MLSVALCISNRPTQIYIYIYILRSLAFGLELQRSCSCVCLKARSPVCADQVCAIAILCDYSPFNFIRQQQTFTIRLSLLSHLHPFSSYHLRCMSACLSTTFPLIIFSWARSATCSLDRSLETKWCLVRGPGFNSTLSYRYAWNLTERFHLVSCQACNDPLKLCTLKK